jgi:hypothetical protein
VTDAPLGVSDPSISHARSNTRPHSGVHRGAGIARPVYRRDGNGRLNNIAYLEQVGGVGTVVGFIIGGSESVYSTQCLLPSRIL